MILNDGGKGEYSEVTVPMLGIWDTVLAVGSTPLPVTQLLRALAALDISISHVIFTSLTSDTPMQPLRA